MVSMTISEMETLRDALVKAIASGISEVIVGDKTIRYQSIQQMQQALAALDRELKITSGATITRAIFIQHSR
jgi:hypothetical protein